MLQQLSSAHLRVPGRIPLRSGPCVALFLAWLHLLAGCAHRGETAPQERLRHTLRADQTTLLTPPSGTRFDASGLQILRDGTLVTVGNTHGATPYRIEFQPGNAEAKLIAVSDYFPSNGVASVRVGGRGPLDCEGLALDDRGRLYVCLERERWILRSDRAGQVERLPIDWKPVEHHFSRVDSNASFEGIAIGGGRLYVANERQSPILIEVDLATLTVRRDYLIHPGNPSWLGLHYSDLCWFENRLWILCRQHYVVLEVDPGTRQVLAEYDYREIESRLGYATGLPIGLMEGLAVDRDFIWLVTDNNGDVRRGAPRDRRPTLIRCRRPGR